MVYELFWDSKAEKQLSKLDKSVQKDIQAYINQFVKTENPKQKGYGLKHQLSGLWRYDIGQYRLLCEIREEQLIIIAVKVGHRKHVYDR